MRWWGFVGRTGIARNHLVTLEVTGRRSGRVISLPLVPIRVDGERYLASMLGDDVAWVRNVRANDGRAVLVAGGREDVVLVELPAAERAPYLKALLRVAPGARPHIPVDMDAPVVDFESIAADYPMFRIARAPRA